MTDLPCRGMTDVFFSDTPKAIAAAKAACARCHRAEECAEEGQKIPYGVWGGVANFERGFRRGQVMKRGIMPGKTTDKILRWIQANPEIEHTSTSVNQAVPEIKRAAVCKALNRLTEDGLIKRREGARQPMYRLREKALT